MPSRNGKQQDGRNGPDVALRAVSHTDHSAVDLYWLPLGAGGHFVRINGRAYETVAARMARRPACALYHSALEVRLDSERFVIEMAPIFDAPPSSAASSPKGRSAHAGPDAPGCFATASDGGLTDASPTSTRRSTALTDSATNAQSHDVCLTSSRRCRRRCGAGMNYRPAACGTRTP